MRDGWEVILGFVFGAAIVLGVFIALDAISNGELWHALAHVVGLE